MNTDPNATSSPHRRPTFGPLTVAWAILALVCVAVLVLWWPRLPAPPGVAYVEGVVTQNGRPLDSVEVAFLPDPERNTFGAHGRAVTDAEGRYSIRTEREGKDGVVAGWHRIIVVDLKALASPGGFAEGKGARESPNAAKSRVPEDYSSSARTPWRLELKPGTHTKNLEVPLPPAPEPKGEKPVGAGGS